MRNREIIKGLIISFTTTMAVFCVMAMLYSKTDVREDFTEITIKITTIISVAMGALISGRKVKNKGWLNGASIGFLYMVAIFACGAFVKGDIWFITKKIRPVIINMLIGIFCGIVGVNTKTKKLKRHV